MSGKSEGGATVHYTRDDRGALISERTSAGAYVYLLDGEGSVVGLTGSGGTLAASYAYDPYGNLTSSSGAQAAANP